MPVASTPRWRWSGSWPLWVIAALAVGAGLYARFKGLGAWPLGVDEFYISRSIDNILRSGLPEYECGGYYGRGLLYQYIVAGMRTTGLSPELASRLVTATASLLTLPAAWLLGRRIAGHAVGWLMVILLSVSVWEIEMARFARMYAPFQAVFAWYLVFFLRYTVDRERAALLPMTLLSVLGVLTWEGGALLGIANLLPPFLKQVDGRLRRGDWLYLGGMLVLFVALYATTWDMRGSPEETDLAADEVGADGYADIYAPWMTVGWYPVALVLALIPAGLSLASLRWIWTFRNRWLTASGLCVALLLALLHQFLACAAVLVLLALTGLLDWRELLSRPARVFIGAVLVAGVYWLAFGLLTQGWHDEIDPAMSVSSRLLLLAQMFLGFPNVIDEIARPWLRAIPLLSLGLFTLLAGLTIATLKRNGTALTAERALICLLLVLLLLVGASGAPRHETRYAFFLYPLMLLLAVTTLARLSEITVGRRAGAATIIVVLGLFALSEDFQPRHLATIDSQATNFRLDVPPAVRSHYYPRNDIRSAANVLQAQVSPGDLVIAGIPNLDQYFDDIDYFFLDEADDRQTAYACGANWSTERWTNLPLLRTTDALGSAVAPRGRAFIVIYPSRLDRLQAGATANGWQLEQVWSSIDGGVRIVALNVARPL